MKALIIDDEPHVITVTRLLVEWSDYGIDSVFDCGSAEAAMEIIEQERPEIILSDINLPGLNGLDLIQMIRDKRYAAQVILITAYGDFSYARKALQLGCVEYLLKPLSEKPLNQAVEKAVRLFRETSERDTGTARIQIRQKLSQYLSSEYSPAIFSDLCQLIPEWKSMEVCRAGLICTRHLPYEFINGYPVMDKIQEIMDEYNPGAVCNWQSGGDIFILLKDQGSNTDETWYKIKEMIRETMGTGLPMSISGGVLFPDGLRRAYQAVKEAAMTANLLDPELAFAVEDSITPPFDRIVQILTSVFFSGNDEKNVSAVNEIMDQLLLRNVMTLKTIETFRVVYNSVRTQCVLAQQGELGLERSTPEPFSTSFFTREGCFDPQYMAELLLGDIRKIESRYADDTEILTTGEICLRVQRYMETHYADDITLELLASRFGISSGYLSRSFKKEMGIGLIDALARIRIEQACLFLQGSMRMTDIANAVGFADPKYFSRVFKKVKGISPADYREQRRDGAL